MAAHAHLKNDFTEEEKYHNLMSWLIVLILCVNAAQPSVDLDQILCSSVSDPSLCSFIECGILK